MDDPRRAITWFSKLRQRAEQLAEMPYAFPLSPRHAALGLRRRPVGSYLIYYRSIGPTVEIVRIVHAARDAGAVPMVE